MEPRTKLNQLLRSADGAVAALLAEANPEAPQDTVQAFRTTVDALCAQAQAQALDTVDRWAPSTVCADLAPRRAERLERLAGQLLNALHRVPAAELAADLRTAVRGELRWLFKNAQIAALRQAATPCRWSLDAAAEACPVCAALARADVDDLDALAALLADDDCGSTLLVTRPDVERVTAVVGRLVVDNVPIDHRTAVEAHLRRLMCTGGPLLRTEAHLAFAADDAVGLRWDAHWRTTLAEALVDVAALPLARLTRAYDQLTTDGCTSVSGVYSPSLVIYPSARRDVEAYARACAAAVLVDPQLLRAVDERAWTVLSEELLERGRSS